MGKILDFNAWKKRSDLLTSAPDKSNLHACPNCNAPALKFGDTYEYNEDSLVDFLYYKSEELIEELQQQADGITVKINKLQETVSNNETRLGDVLSGFED